MAYSKYGKEMMRQIKKRELLNKEWYSIRSILGCDWAMFYFLLGGREAGKSYAVTDFFCRQFELYGRPFYWLRLTEASQRKLLANNAEKLIDPDLRRIHKLDLMTKGDNVYNVIKRDKDGKVKEKKLMARVLALSTFYNDKGSGLFDKDFLKDPNMYYNICLDEMNREKNEKKTFDIVYAFVNQIENLIRSTKNRVRIICIGNTLEEASDMLIPFNFLPEKFGRYKLHSKRAVIDYIEPSEKYLKRREGTVASLLTPDDSTFTNEVIVDRSMIIPGKQRLIVPHTIIMFSKKRSDWFVIWDDNIISMYNGERTNDFIAMRPYINQRFTKELQTKIYQIFQAKAFKFRNLMTQKKFQKELELLKPNGVA